MELFLAVATATAAAVSTAAAAAATAALRALFGFVDLDGAPIEILPVELLDGGAGRLVGTHGDECEAAGAARFAINGHAHFPYFTNGGELRLDGFLGGIE